MVGGFGVPAVEPQEGEGEDDGEGDLDDAFVHGHPDRFLQCAAEHERHRGGEDNGQGVVAGDEDLREEQAHRQGEHEGPGVDVENIQHPEQPDAEHGPEEAVNAADGAGHLVGPPLQDEQVGDGPVGRLNPSAMLVTPAPGRRA